MHVSQGPVIKKAIVGQFPLQRTKYSVTRKLNLDVIQVTALLEYIDILHVLFCKKIRVKLFIASYLHNFEKDI